MSPLRLPLLVAFVVTSIAGGATFGCGRGGALKEAASADLRCPPSRLHISGVGSQKYVQACGQRATYRLQDDEWMMISHDQVGPDGQVIQPSGPAQAPPSVKAGPPGVTPAQPAMTPTGTPSMPPSSPPPPAPGQKAL